MLCFITDHDSDWLYHCSSLLLFLISAFIYWSIAIMGSHCSLLESSIAWIVGYISLLDYTSWSLPYWFPHLYFGLYLPLHLGGHSSQLISGLEVEYFTYFWAHSSSGPILGPADSLCRQIGYQGGGFGYYIFGASAFGSKFCLPTALHPFLLVSGGERTRTQPAWTLLLTNFCAPLQIWLDSGMTGSPRGSSFMGIIIS